MKRAPAIHPISGLRSRFDGLSIGRVLRWLALPALVACLAFPLLTATGAPRITSPVAPDGPGSSARAKVGARVTDLAFTDLSGRSYTEAALANHRATVFLFLATECPVSNGYTPRIDALATEYASKGVGLFAAYPNAQETPGGIARSAKERGYGFPLVQEGAADLARRLGARMTPEAVVLDEAGTIRYKGRIDNDPEGTQVTRADLREALDDLLSGRSVARSETRAFGCFIELPSAGSHASGRRAKVTYARDVAPILQQNCQSCHRPGEVGPMPFTTYEQTRAFAQTIKDVTGRRIMPPWHAAEGFGAFRYSRRLSDTQVATLAAWADAGAPMGNPKDMPPPRQFPTGWLLGQPDAVFHSDEPYHVAADGADVYRDFVLPTHFDGDRYVTAIEVHPDNRKVVHHVIAYIDRTGKSLPLDVKDPGPGFTSTGAGPGFDADGMLGGWAPGNEPRVLPEGIAILLPKGSYVVMQVHYHKDGKPETDRSEIGLYFAKGPVHKFTFPVPIVNTEMVVPAGASHHEIDAEWTAPEDMHAISVMPHMHLLGREMKVTATRPDGTVVPLVYVPDWDFRWQDTYMYQEPVALPKGTKVRVVAYYDNSEGNSNNPNHPPKEVRWGEQTTDEMCLAFIGVTRDAENLALMPPGGGKPDNVSSTTGSNAVRRRTASR